MTIELDSWQPILVAVIGALAALGVPIVTSIIASRNAAAAADTAKGAAQTAAAIGDKVDSLAEAADKHTQQLHQIGVAVNGERDAARRRIKELEDEVFRLSNPQDKSDGH